MSLQQLPEQKSPGAPEWLSRLSARLLVSVQVMISWFMSSSPALGSVLTAWSLLGILSLPPSLSLPLPLLAPSLSLSKEISKHKEEEEQRSPPCSIVLGGLISHFPECAMFLHGFTASSSSSRWCGRQWMRQLQGLGLIIPWTRPIQLQTFTPA